MPVVAGGFATEETTPPGSLVTVGVAFAVMRKLATVAPRACA
jgi:hypothetical protein